MLGAFHERSFHLLHPQSNFVFPVWIGPLPPLSFPPAGLEASSLSLFHVLPATTQSLEVAFYTGLAWQRNQLPQLLPLSTQSNSLNFKFFSSLFFSLNIQNKQKVTKEANTERAVDIL